MPAQAFLVAKFNRYTGRRAARAMDLAEDLYANDPEVPVDTGNLQGNVRIINRFIAAPRYRAILTARAISRSGADYAAILEAAPRIAPRTRQFLRFEVGGEVVFSRGFDNVHYQWWTRLTTKRPSLWRQAIIQAGREVRY